MELVPFVVTYITIGILTIAVLARFFMWSKMPMHVRWELYPVAHEASRAHYGGSYLEEVDWWKKPREVSMLAELKEMIPEILFLVALKEHNRKLWTFSFPFHFGLYLVIGATAVMFGAGVLGAIWPNAIVGGFGSFLTYVAMACAYAGLGLSLLGALGLLFRRLTDGELKDFTSGADIFNLLFFLVAFGCAAAHLLIVDRDLSKSMFFVQSLVTFKMDVALQGSGTDPLFTTTTVVLMGLLVAYIPLTHMSHFVGKYFAYHSIRWNDAPNLKGGDQEAAIHEVLGYPVSWAAPHIKGDGKKSWAEVATEEQKK
jgi:nitrate reductase gamma subunit